MGRYLAIGVLAEIKMERYKECPEYNFLVEEEKILNQLSKYVAVESYEKVVNEDGMILTLKKEIFNDNFHELLKEVNALVHNCGCLFDTLNEECNINTKKDFDQKSYPVKLIRGEGRYGQKDILMVKTQNGQYELYYPYPKDYWLFYGRSRDFLEYFRLKDGLIILWESFEKIDSENDSEILDILNTLKHNYFTNPLAKNLVFSIIG